MEREGDSSRDRKRGIAKGELSPVTPFTAYHDGNADDHQGKREAPCSYCEWVSVRQSDEWTSERNSEQREAENPGWACSLTLRCGLHAGETTDSSYLLPATSNTTAACYLLPAYLLALTAESCRDCSR
jgi:hypothetical protein